MRGLLSYARLSFNEFLPHASLSLSLYPRLSPYTDPHPRGTGNPAQSNELRRINTMMKTDLEQVASRELRGMDRAAAISEAESTLDHVRHNGGATGIGADSRTSSLFRQTAGTVLGAIRFQTNHRGRAEATAQEQDSKGKEMGQWEVQQPAVGESGTSIDSKDSTTNQVCILCLRWFSASLGLG